MAVRCIRLLCLRLPQRKNECRRFCKCSLAPTIDPQVVTHNLRMRLVERYREKKIPHLRPDITCFNRKHSRSQLYALSLILLLWTAIPYYGMQNHDNIWTDFNHLRKVFGACVRSLHSPYLWSSRLATQRHKSWRDKGYEYEVDFQIKLSNRASKLQFVIDVKYQ